jgi:hypothetical protein
MLGLADRAIDRGFSGLERRQQVVQPCKRRTHIGRPRGRRGLFAFGSIHEHHAHISAGFRFPAA